MVQFVSIKAELNRNKSKCRKFQDVFEVIEMNFVVFFAYWCGVFSLMFPNWFIAYSGDVMIRSYKSKILANKKGRGGEQNERAPSQSLKFYYT